VYRKREGYFMRFYECTIILRPELSKSQVEAVQAELVAVLKNYGGTTSRHEYWGLRSLAYPIEKLSRAHYIFFNATVSGEAIIEMERQMRIREDILRYLSVRVEKLDEEPSPMMQAKFRDEQRDTRGNQNDDRLPKSNSSLEDVA
jgi:small subunit ribosomal protein S6